MQRELGATSTVCTHVPPFYLTSGTGGLQEAITNGPVKGGGPNTIIPQRGAAGAGAGTSPALTAGYNSDVSGYDTVTTGSSPTASGIVFTITFGAAYNFPGPKCLVFPGNAAAQALATGAQPAFLYADESQTTAALRAGATALAATTTYMWGYACTN